MKQEKLFMDYIHTFIDLAMRYPAIATNIVKLSEYYGSNHKWVYGYGL